ncbi:MAG TPA: AraC family transcriptional regulator [Gemmatimonadaceae bacterium]|jgi:AraC-like DNA-binding protein|nr:AraC family transcriptional regulator [Gemmatimonadaceae bacterium]
MDALADVLDLSRVSGAVLARVRAHEPWGVAVAPTRGAAFHAIAAGMCWLSAGSEPPRQLMPGDVVLLPAGAPHRLTSAPGLRAREFSEIAKAQRLSPNGELVLDGPGAATSFLCAGYTYDNEIAHPLMSLFPAVLHLAASDANSPSQATLRLLAVELERPAVGTGVVIQRLIDVLLVHVIREWMRARKDNDVASWIRGLRDPAIAKVLAILHHRPAERWTVARLAEEAHMARSTLARRFVELVGETPLGYLGRWRMDLAAQMLRDTEEPVAAVGRRVGYHSEFAFSRAFSRARGEPPARFRRAHRTTRHRDANSLL